jgi:hypothetical protein
MIDYEKTPLERIKDRRPEVMKRAEEARKIYPDPVQALVDLWKTLETDNKGEKMKKSINLRTKKLSFYFDIGWYDRENFALFNLSLFDNLSDDMNIFYLKIIKLNISFGFDWE